MHRWAKQASTENPECFFQIDVHNSEILEAYHNGYCNQLLFKKSKHLKTSLLHSSERIRFMTQCQFAW